MRVLLTLLYKDFLLLIRDKAGLILLFVMPMALVLIMTSMQDGVMSADKNTDISLLVLNEDCDSIGNTMEKELKESDVFSTHLAKNIGKEMTEQKIKDLVAKGKYLVGIYIPQNTTKKFTDNFTNELRDSFTGKNNDSSVSDSIFIKVFIDPTVKPSVQATLKSNINEFCMKIQNKYSLAIISRTLEKFSGNRIQNLNLTDCQGLTIEEYNVGKNNTKNLCPNAVQHNVPAWTLFAIFFIVISLSGNIIKEREDGSFNRIMTMPCTFAHYLLSKVLLYLFVCILQFLVILGMGMWFFPLINLDPFVIQGSFYGLLFVIIFAAFAAIGFGTAISAIATSQQQASVFGAVSVVILAAIGGIWVPTFAMPNFLKILSNISPLNWALDASYSVILRKSSVIDVLPECFYLLSFGIICFSIAIFYKNLKHR